MKKILNQPLELVISGESIECDPKFKHREVNEHKTADDFYDQLKAELAQEFGIELIEFCPIPGVVGK